MSTYPENHFLARRHRKGLKTTITKRKYLLTKRDNSTTANMLFCPAVHVYLQMLQEAICRYSNFCMNCKMMCVGMITAYSFILSSSSTGLLVPFLIVFSCFTMNVRYLGYERAYKKKYNIFLKLAKSTSKSESKQELFEMGVEIKEFSNVLCKVISLLCKSCIACAMHRDTWENTFNREWEKNLKEEFKDTVREEYAAYKDPPNLAVYLTTCIVYFGYYMGRG